MADYAKDAKKELGRLDQRTMRDVMRLVSDGYTVKAVNRNQFQITPPDGGRYMVTDRGEGLSCTCPARTTCKHQIMVTFLRRVMPQLRY